MLRHLSAVLLRGGPSDVCQLASRCEISVTAGCRHLATASSAAQADTATAGSEQHNGVSSTQRADVSAAATSPLRGHEGRTGNPQQLLERFRMDNESMPYLQGQVVKARVAAVDRHTVLLNPGYKYMQRFFRSELAGVPIFSQSGERLGVPEQLQEGDILHVRIDALETPFRDMQLSLGVKVSEQEHMDAVLKELQRAKESGASVMGRILNPVNAGYAVGIGGLVCFCPMTQCLYQTAARVGVLQPFKVNQIKAELRNVVVSDAAKVALSGGFSGFRPNKPRANSSNSSLRAAGGNVSRPAVANQAAAPDAKGP